MSYFNIGLGMRKLCVVIPTYKGYNKLSENEKKSFLNTTKKLKEHDIFIVCPESLETEDYEKFNIKIKRFNNECFGNIKAYNELMLSSNFYEAFDAYEYMLIAQLDCWIFNNKIDFFISLNYDYIGCLHLTPWTGKQLVNGNGGLCLRKISSMIAAATNIKKDLNCKWDWEDILYSFWYKDKLNIAPYGVSLKFGWQQNIEDCFTENNNELPFGCHKPDMFWTGDFAKIINKERIYEH